MTVDYVAFGIIIDDIVFPDGHTEMGILGGGGPQTAWGMAAALGGGQRVGLVAGIGYDVSEGMLEPLRRAQVNLSGIRTTEHPTPRAWQLMEADGGRTQVWRTSPEHIRPQLQREWGLLPADYHAARVFHWGVHGVEDIPVFAQDLKARQKWVSLESFRAPTKAPSVEQRAALFAACDVFSPTTEELNHMMGTTDVHFAIQECQAAGLQYLVVRQGVHGAVIYDFVEGRVIRVPAVAIDVVDEVGAGNAFCGAFLAGLEKDAIDAACHGAVAASYMLEQIGLPPRLPDRAAYQQRFDQVRAKVKVSALDQ